uniref:Polyprotein n=1 Tax=Haemonchus placei TaxID=6290 RepID=A0A0N4X7F6_HAEPC
LDNYTTSWSVHQRHLRAFVLFNVHDILFGSFSFIGKNCDHMLTDESKSIVLLARHFAHTMH